jgi:hypothetical protein
VIDLMEVLSGRQTPARLREKLEAMRDALPEGMRGHIGVIDIDRSKQ